MKTKQNYVWTKDAERSSKLVSSEKADTSTKLDLRTKSATGSKVSAEQNTSGKKRIALAPSSQVSFHFYLCVFEANLLFLFYFLLLLLLLNCSH